ncbi:hypothetical protein [Streptomyces coeruleorubidus]|uniref:hypothetical protein n=1 Tax=Streptomyces coeruleorubidus TaxID=116188 RepID=UPI0033B9719F
MKLVAVPADGTTEDRASRRSGDSGLGEDEVAWRMARMDRNWDFLDGQRRHVVTVIDADDQERYQFAQMGGFDTQQGQHSQNAEGDTSRVEQLAAVMGGAVGVLEAREHY